MSRMKVPAGQAPQSSVDYFSSGVRGGVATTSLTYPPPLASIVISPVLMFTVTTHVF